MTHQSGWAREKWPCARPMAYTRHFQPYKIVLLVAGLRAGRPGEEKLVPLYSQILLISSIIPPTVTHQSSWEREKWPCAYPMAYIRHFEPFKTVLLVAGLRAGGPGAVGRCSLMSKSRIFFQFLVGPSRSRNTDSGPSVGMIAPLLSLRGIWP